MEKLNGFAVFILVAALSVSMFAGLYAVSPSLAQVQYTNLREGGSIPLPSGVVPDYRVKTNAHLSFRPNPVGVGQKVLINVWLVPPPHVSRYFNNMTVIITDPEGKAMVISLKSYRGDATAWYEFAPNKVGVWRIKFEFLGGYFPAGNYTVYPGAAVVTPGVVSFRNSVYYEPSSDGPYDLVVQEQPVPMQPPAPLPSEYWTRPVTSPLREWWPILGWYPPWGIVSKEDNPWWPEKQNRFAQSIYRYVPYVQAPETAHIMWRRVGTIGGLIGGPFETTSWTTSPGGPSIIYAGRCYQSLTKVFGGSPQTVWQCYDLRTGEILWERTGLTQIPTMVTYWVGYPEVPGGQPMFGRNVFLTYVGGGRLIYYSPITGAASYNVSISPLTTGTLYANYDHPYFLTVQDLGPAAGRDRYRLINWTVYGDYERLRILDVRLRIVSNISWPVSSLGVIDFETGYSAVVTSLTNPATGTPMDARIRIIDLKTGTLVHNFTANVPFNVWPGETIADHGKLAVRFGDGHLYCWDLRTGKFLWKSEMSSWPWGVFGAYGISSYNGKIIVGQYDGIAAYDWETGKLVWLYQYKAQYPYETYYQDNYPFFAGSPLIADGKVYMPNNEHTPTQPITRNWRLHCVDAETGRGLWSLPGTGTIMAIADGYLVFACTYDGCMYVIGKGPSATTVEVQPASPTIGQSIVISGRVLDISPGTRESSIALRFPSGVPAVADEYMGDWMGYVYMQLPKPANITGVWVKLDAVNVYTGEYIDIGGTHTDPHSGMFTVSWQPPKEGLWWIIASFPGSKSYYPSFAQTSIAVTPAPAPVEIPTPASPEQVSTVQATVEALQPIITALAAAVIACICLVAYDIYINRKMLKQAAKQT